MFDHLRQTPGKTLTLSSIYAVRNNGTLRALNGSVLAASGLFTNAGLITAGAASTVKLTGTLSHTGTGRTDLAGGSLVLNYSTTSPAASVRDQLRAARDSGAWDTTTGLTSSAAANDPNHLTAVAYAEASTLLHLSGFQTAPWANTTVDATALLLTPALYGDANLDGAITPDDYTLLDRSLVLSRTNASWTDGDFNYDGIVDQNDYLLIDTAYAKAQGSFPGSLLADRESQFGPTYVTTLLTSVPEPRYLCSTLLSPLLLNRRRASHRRR